MKSAVLERSVDKWNFQLVGETDSVVLAVEDHDFDSCFLDSRTIALRQNSEHEERSVHVALCQKVLPRHSFIHRTDMRESLISLGNVLWTAFLHRSAL